MKPHSPITLAGISPSIAREMPSWRSGMMSLANILGKERFSRYLPTSDADALRADWRSVGNDMRKAMHRYEK